MNNLGAITKGVRTSEFWAILIPFIAGVLSHAGLHITSDAIVAAAEGAATIYAALRTFLKQSHIKTVASVNNVLSYAGQVVDAIDQGAKEAAVAPPAAPVVSPPAPNPVQ